MTSVIQDPLGAGCKRIVTTNLTIYWYLQRSKALFMVALHVYFKLFLFKKRCQIVSKDLEGGSKAVGLYNAISDSIYPYNCNVCKLITNT